MGSQAAVPKPGTGNFEQRFIRELRSQGMEVSVGYPRMYTQADCVYSYPVFHNCYGNNPASPYVIPVVKSWPEEYVDPAMKNGFGRTRPGYSATYRLDPDGGDHRLRQDAPAGEVHGAADMDIHHRMARDGSPWDADAYNMFAQMTQYCARVR